MMIYKISRTAKSKHIGNMYKKLIDAKATRVIMNLTTTHHIYGRESFGQWTLIIK